jgi:hypothetical protein
VDKKQKSHPNSVLCGSSSGHGCKNAPKLTTIGCKTHGLPETQTAIPNVSLKVKLCLHDFLIDLLINFASWVLLGNEGLHNAN